MMLGRISLLHNLQWKLDKVINLWSTSTEHDANIDTSALVIIFWKSTPVIIFENEIIERN